jgi:hypothetical protein
MSDQTAGIGVHWAKRSGSFRILRRMVFGIAAAAGLLWLVARIEDRNQQRGIETTRATGLSAYVTSRDYAPKLDKGLVQQMMIAQPAASPEGSRIARTASLQVSVANFSAARESVDRIVKSHGGFAASVTIASPGESVRSLSGNFEVPAEQCDAALQEFRSLGHVEEERQGSRDVTAQSDDLEIRLTNSREEETRLKNLLRVGTGKISEVLEVENEITRVREEVENMEGEQKRLNNRVVFAAIDLNLSEDFKAEPGIRSSQLVLQIRNASIDGYHGAADGFLSAIELALSAGPSVLLWGAILFWPGRWAWRRWRNTRASSLPVA